VMNRPGLGIRSPLDALEVESKSEAEKQLTGKLR
jgi:hypothetical protein